MLRRSRSSRYASGKKRQGNDKAARRSGRHPLRVRDGWRGIIASGPRRGEDEPAAAHGYGDERALGEACGAKPLAAHPDHRHVAVIKA